MWDAIRQNVRDAARGLRRTPGTAAAIIILLALGIGANATMFEIVDRLLLRPPDHVVDADRLRMVYSQRPTLSLPQFARNLTYSDVADHQKPARARIGGRLHAAPPDDHGDGRGGAEDSGAARGGVVLHDARRPPADRPVLSPGRR